MEFGKEEKVIKEQISLYGKEIFADGEDPFVFAEFLASQDFENAYKMLSDALKTKMSIEELKSFAIEDLLDTNPVPNNFQEDQIPYKKVAIEFANQLVQKEFEKAFDMLTDELNQENTIASLEKNMRDMTSYFENPDNIWVETQFVLDEGVIDDKYIYVPIEENGNSEAVTVEIFKENDKALIRSIEWGRP